MWLLLANLKIKDKSKKPDNMAKWKKFKHEPENIDCLHCKFQQAEDSIPIEEFTKLDEEGKQVTVKEITIIRGSKDDVLGWVF